MNNKFKFIDLFAGAGGLAEGFYRCGFQPVCHIEMNESACETLKTRLAYHYLKENNKLDIYHSYLTEMIDRETLYSYVPEDILSSVMNVMISEDNLDEIFDEIDKKILSSSTNKIDVIVGGPPCQAYSMAGRSSKRKEPIEKDPKNYLYELYIEFIKKYNPDFFIFENVVGLLTANKGKYFSDFIDKAEKAGYGIKHKVLNSEDYGVLQSRRRVIVIGYKNSKCSDVDLFPDPIDTSYFCVGDILNDLSPLIGTIINNEYIDEPSTYLKRFCIRDSNDVLTLHQTRLINDRDRNIYATAIELWNNKKQRLNYANLPEYLKNHRNQKAFLDRFKVVAADLHSSQTMLAHIAKDGHYFIHPDINQSRSLSVREAARIQSFPDSYYFEGSRSAKFTQIGNAVPPLMAEQIANKISAVLTSIQEDKQK